MITINVAEVLQIRSHPESRKADTLDIDVVITTHQAERLFYNLWGTYGNDVLNEWLKNEGCELKITEKQIATP